MSANPVAELAARIVTPEDRAALAAQRADNRSLRIDWQAIAAADAGEGDPDAEYRLADVEGVASDLIARPQTVLGQLDEAVGDLGDPETDRPLSRVTTRPYNLPDEATFVVGAFSPSRHRRKLLELEGQITKRTEKQPAIREAVYQCSRCRQPQTVPQPPFGKRRKPPAPCDCDTRAQFKAWRLDREASTWADHQKLRLQQPPEHALGETKHIDVHVFGDLAGNEAIEGGKRVKIVGTFREVENRGRVNFRKRVIGRSVTPDQEVFDDEDIAAYEDVIESIREDSDRFDKLVASVAPGHTGDRLVREALTLVLFTGGRWQAPDGMIHRGDSHVQLIGDPGTNKSGLLQSLHERVPIGAYVDGPGSSGVGLTAAITKDDFSDGDAFSIEAGALVRASGGSAFIDELDKFKQNDLSALHTPLERQEVLVSKAGKRATLPAETGVVAAANPAGGHYDPRREFIDQVDVQSPLLSRFDLIYVMREKVDPTTVRKVARGMIESRQQAAKLERGELDPVEVLEANAPLSPDEFKAYVAAAQRITPTFDPDGPVAAAIIDWYEELKTELPNRYRETVDRDAEDMTQGSLPLPITARKVDAIQRLAAASARIRFDDTVTMADVERVRPLIKRSLADIGIPVDNEAFGSADSSVSLEEVGIDV